MPIEERRAKLHALVKRQARDPAILFNEPFDAEGTGVFAQACALGLEGIVSKRRDSTYQSGRASSWVKTLNPDYKRP